MFILRDSNLLLLILSCTTTLILMAVRHSISPTNSSGKIVVTKFQPSYPFRDFLMNPATPEIPMHLFMPMRDPKVCAEIFLAMMYNPSGDVILGPFQSLIQKYSNETIIITDAKPDICFFSPHEGGVFIPYLFLKDGWRLRYNSKFVEWVEKRIALSGKSNDILASSAVALHVFPLKARLLGLLMQKKILLIFSLSLYFYLFQINGIGPHLVPFIHHHLVMIPGQLE